MLDFFIQCRESALCNFDKTPTLPILLFELLVIGGAIAAYFLLSRLKDRIGLRLIIVAIGVFIFELFTAPMWHNFKLGWWAYLYRDVSWILTVGWSVLILSVVLLVDQKWPNRPEWQRFLIYMGSLMGLVTLLELIVVNLGIRSYSPEVIESTISVFIAGVPIVDVLYYTPVFTGLVVGFYKYWSFYIDQELLVPVKKRHWWRGLLIAFIGVFLFEVMVEPMVRNENLPQWSYIYRDVSILMTGLWILVVWLATNVVEKLLIHISTLPKFLLTLLLTGAMALPIEAWFIIQGHRVYGQSAVANFTGFLTPITHIPVEVAFAIPCYMALVIAFIRYWETLLDNRL